MHRFYLESEEPSSFYEGRKLELPNHISHQVVNVLRMRRDDELVLFNGDGSEWASVVEDVKPSGRSSSVTTKLVSRSRPEVEMNIDVTMVLALTRSDRFETALAKCTELGAKKFVPVVSERVLGGERSVSAGRHERWKRIVVEATELSGRVVPPAVSPSTTLENALGKLQTDRVPTFFLWEKTESSSLLQTLQDARGAVAEAGCVAMVIGPVGGFTRNEAQVAANLGAREASLGTLILRTETAAISAMAVASQLWA